MDPVFREKIIHIAQTFLPDPVSCMTFILFESRIPRNFVANPESRGQKGPYPASHETPSGAQLGAVQKLRNADLVIFDPPPTYVTSRNVLVLPPPCVT